MRQTALRVVSSAQSLVFGLSNSRVTMGGLNSFSQHASTGVFGRECTNSSQRNVIDGTPTKAIDTPETSAMFANGVDEPGRAGSRLWHRCCRRLVNAARRRRSRPRSDQAKLPPSKEHRLATGISLQKPTSDAATRGCRRASGVPVLAVPARKGFDGDHASLRFEANRRLRSISDRTPARIRIRGECPRRSVG